MYQDASFSGSHLSVEEIAIYVDLLTEGSVRLRVETHLVHCDVCLADVVAVVRVLHSSLPTATRARPAGRTPSV